MMIDAEQRKESLNARRRERYKSDPEYRAKQIEAARATRRGEIAEDDELLLRLQNYTSYGKSMLGLQRGRGAKAVVLGAGKAYTLQDMSRVMGHKTYSVVRDWVDRGMLPKPRHTAYYIDSADRLPVWTANEMRAIVSVLKMHFSQSRYYGEYHEETKAEMVTAFASVKLPGVQ